MAVAVVFLLGWLVDDSRLEWCWIAADAALQISEALAAWIKTLDKDIVNTRRPCSSDECAISAEGQE